MKAKNSVIIVSIAALIAACTPSAEDGSKYVGIWQTPPVPSTRAGNQFFIEITADTPPNYIVNFTRKGSVLHGSAGNDRISQRYKSVYTMKEGKLVSDRNPTIYLDSQGVLHHKSIEYRK